MKPKDIAAYLVIVGYIVLKLAGKDSALDPALFLILGYYFTKRQAGIDNGK